MKSKFKMILLTLTIFLSGCHSINVVTDPLEIPTKLVIPDNLRVLDKEWDCLGTVLLDPVSERIRRSKCKAFIKLGQRSKLKSARNQTLRGIIMATHPKGE